MSSIQPLLDQTRGLATTKAQGDAFESVTAFYLRADPVLGPQVRQVWRWADWPDRDGRDIGIDLVVATHDDKLWAVQAKGYAPTTTVAKADVDSFLSASAGGRFDDRLLVCSTNLLTNPARTACAYQHVKLHDLSALEAATISWPQTLRELHAADPAVSLRQARRELRPHQVRARDAVVAELAEQLEGEAGEARTTLVMACGTGKTLTCQGISESLGARSTLVLVPSLNLVSQTLAEWSAQAAGGAGMRAVAVCSDATTTAGIKTADVDIAMDELTFPVVSDPVELAGRLSPRPGDGRPLVVFSTYHSSPVVAAAQSLTKTTFDLVVADEAHYLAGQPSDTFRTVLDSFQILARRRVFATATPRLVAPHLQRKATLGDAAVSSMDDIDVFGPVAHRLTFAAAFGQGLLSDYQILVLGLDPTSRLSPVMPAGPLTGRLILADGELVDASVFAAAVATGRCVAEQGVRSAVSFHSSVSRARAFISLVSNLAVVAPAAAPVPVVHGGLVAGSQPVSDRRAALRQLTTSGRDGEPARVLANVRCLTEGIDVPSLDAVVFADPRRSTVAVVQAVGRALRLDPDNPHKRGLIVIPVVIDPACSPDAAMRDASFDIVWEVLGALCDHDEVLADQMRRLRVDLGRGVPVPPDALPKLVLDSWLSADFAAALRTRVVEVTTTSFEAGLGQLQAYAAEHGSACPPALLVTATGFRLGNWVNSRRTEYGQGVLSPSRVSRLEAVSGWTWDVLADDFNAGLSQLRAYVAVRQTAVVPQKYVTADGFRLGAWVVARRTGYRSGALDARRAAELERVPGWDWDLLASAFDKGVKALQDHVASRGSASVPTGFRTADGFGLGSWVSSRRQDYRRGDLSPDRVLQLEAVPGWTWDPFAAAFEQGFAELLEYVGVHGTASVPQLYVSPSGFRLGSWVNGRRNSQRVGKRRGQLETERVARLEAQPGWAWGPQDDSFEEGFAALLVYLQAEGTTLVPKDFVTPDGYCLGSRVHRWRALAVSGRLSAERVARLGALPSWSWGRRILSFEAGFSELQDYVAQFGTADVPGSYRTGEGVRLGVWVMGRRQAFRKGTLGVGESGRLAALPGWVWRAPLGPRSR